MQNINERGGQSQMNLKRAIIVKYSEIALRGDNKYIFEDKLIKTIRNNLRDFTDIIVKKSEGRILIESTSGDADADEILPRIQNIIGLAYFCPCIMFDEMEIERLRETALNYMKEVSAQNFANSSFTFKVETKRIDKRYPIQSGAVSADIGGFILENLPNTCVDVRNPQVTLFVEIRKFGFIYDSSTVVRGIGGLPYGSSGNGLLLLSGGIDSPVAGFLCAKRGVQITAVYFHSPPYTSERAKDKVCDLAKTLSKYTGGIKLYVVPFTDVQVFLKEHVPPEKLTTIIKRAMLYIAESIAQNEKCQCLITGDAIGQVASQTLTSLAAISTAAKLPIIRPLAGMDKQEIVDVAKSLGTFEISIRPYDDCCTLFLAKHPETKPKLSIIESIESKLMDSLKPMFQQAVGAAEIYDYLFAKE